MPTFDCIVVGGGPAGLSAAIYLGRFNRSVLVIDGGQGRWDTHEINENYLGFPNGIGAKELRQRGITQAKKFGAKFIQDRIEEIKREDKIFHLKGDEEQYQARTVILATGVIDLYPSFRNFESYLGKSIFWCIICDGYKTSNKKVVTVGHDDLAIETCLRLLNYTKDISFLTNCDVGCHALSKASLEALKKHQIPFYEGVIAEVQGKEGRLKKLKLNNDQEIELDYLFSKQGVNPNNQLAAQLDAIIEGEGYIQVDNCQRTSVKFLYTAGDVSSSSAHQIITAAHEGFRAAEAVNEDLLEDWQKVI